MKTNTPQPQIEYIDILLKDVLLMSLVKLGFDSEVASTIAEEQMKKVHHVIWNFKPYHNFVITPGVKIKHSIGKTSSAKKPISKIRTSLSPSFVQAHKENVERDLREKRIVIPTVEKMTTTKNNNKDKKIEEPIDDTIEVPTDRNLNDPNRFI